MMQWLPCDVSRTKLSSPSLPHPDDPDKIIILLSGAEIDQEMVLGLLGMLQLQLHLYLLNQVNCTLVTQNWEI
jgi:hypothetical protein